MGARPQTLRRGRALLLTKASETNIEAQKYMYSKNNIQAQKYVAKTASRLKNIEEFALKAHKYVRSKKQHQGKKKVQEQHPGPKARSKNCIKPRTHLSQF